MGFSVFLELKKARIFRFINAKSIATTALKAKNRYGDDEICIKMFISIRPSGQNLPIDGAYPAKIGCLSYISSHIQISSRLNV